MENKFIKLFMSDISDQFEAMQTLHKQNNLTKSAVNNKIIVDDIYQSLVKLETDLNQEYIIEDLIRLQTIID